MQENSGKNQLPYSADLEKLREKDEEIRKLKKSIANLKYNYKDRLDAIKQLDLLGGGAKEVLLKMIEASVSNPIMGVAGAVIVADVLYRMKIIDLPTFILVCSAGAVVEGSQAAGEIGNIIEDFTSITHLFASQPKPTDPTRPSATTVVFGSKGTPSADDLQALMNRETQQ
jgi:vacuolar-type H+-ATPase subunit I/STV1